MLTICRRARLGGFVLNSNKETLEKLEQYKNLFDKISNSELFNETDKGYNRNFTIIGVVSILENYLNQVLFEVISSFPKKFGNKKFDIKELSEAGSLLELFHKKANQKILDLAYGKFDRFVNEFSKQMEFTAKVDDELVQTINEIKCTRDVIIHSNGKASGLYFSKVGNKARVSRDGDSLTIDDNYVNSSIEFINKLIVEIMEKTPEKIKKSNRSYIFRHMWDSTCLSERISFDMAWDLENENMVRLKDFETTYGYSSTELAIYDMFRSIYSNKFKADFGFILSRWSPKSAEHQIAQSWLDSPFYF